MIRLQFRNWLRYTVPVSVLLSLHGIVRVYSLPSSMRDKTSYHAHA